MLNTIVMLAQSAPPVEFTLPKMRAALTGALVGGVLAFYNDLNQWLKAPAGASWDVKKTFARVLAGAIGGAVVVFGLTVPA